MYFPTTLRTIGVGWCFLVVLLTLYYRVIFRRNSFYFLVSPHVALWPFFCCWCWAFYPVMGLFQAHLNGFWFGEHLIANVYNYMQMRLLENIIFIFIYLPEPEKCLFKNTPIGRYFIFFPSSHLGLLPAALIAFHSNCCLLHQTILFLPPCTCACKKIQSNPNTPTASRPHRVSDIYLWSMSDLIKVAFLSFWWSKSHSMFASVPQQHVRTQFSQQTNKKKFLKSLF